MRRALWQKARRDITARPAASLMLILVIALATMGIVAGVGQRAGAEGKWDDAFARANGAHLALYLKTDQAPAGLLTDPAIEASDQPVPVTRGPLTRGDSDLSLSLRGTGARVPTIGTPLPFTGRWLADGATDEIVLDRSVALALEITDGDELVVRGPGSEHRLRVVGTALDLIDCFYPQCGSAPAWVSPEVVRDIDPRLEHGNWMLPLRLHDPADVGRVGARLQQDHGEQIVGLNDWQDTRKDALATNEFFGAFLGAFAIVLLLAAALVLSSSLSNRTLAQYRELGMLKAVGFTPASIVSLTVIENGVLAVVGIAIGLAGGTLVAPRLQLRFAEIIEGGEARLTPGAAVLATGVVVVIIGIATALPAWRAGHVPASLAIARGAAPRRARASLLARLAAQLRLGAPIVSGVKDAFARPLRATLAILTLAVTVLAFVVTLGFERTIDRIASDAGLVGDPFDIAIVPNGDSSSRVESALAADPAVRSWFTATDRRASTADHGTFLARAVGGDIAAAGFVVREGRQVNAPGEAVVGYGLLRRLGLRVGDDLPMTIGGQPITLSIVGWYSVSEDSGEIVQFSLGDLRAIEPGAAAGTYLVRAKDPAEVGELTARLRAAVGDSADVRPVDRSLDELDAFRAVFFVLTGLVLLIGVANLFGTMALAVRERLRDIAVLKTIGFTPAQVMKSVAASAAVLGVAAALIGVPAGLAVQRLLLDEVGRTAGFGPGLGEAPAVAALTVMAAGTIVLTALIGMGAARRTARTEVSTILRTE